MKRLLQSCLAVCALVMLNGCTKCSQDRPAEMPTSTNEAPAQAIETPPTSEELGNANAPLEEGGEMEMPAEGEMESHGESE